MKVRVLVSGPVEEAKPQEKQGPPGSGGDGGVRAVAEEGDDEGLGERDAEGGEGGLEGSVVGRGVEGGVDPVEEGERVGAQSEPISDGGSDLRRAGEGVRTPLVERIEQGEESGRGRRRGGGGRSGEEEDRGVSKRRRRA